MSEHAQKRIVSLQRALHIAKNALGKIAYNSHGASTVAHEALHEVEMEESRSKPSQLQGLVGHERRPRR